MPHLPLLFPLPISVPDRWPKEIGRSVTEVRSTSSAARPLLPLVVSLKGRISASAMPALDQTFLQLCQSPYVILNLEAVDSLETSVAEYLQSQAQRILRVSASVFSIVVSHNQLRVKSDLDRGKVNYCYNLATPPVAGDSEPNHQKQIRAYETLVDAIRDARYKHNSSTCFLPAKLDFTLATLCKDILHRYASSKQQFVLPELRLVGMMLRVLKHGETIACSEYPFLPAFIVLDGRVAVRQHATSVTGARKNCIRKAVHSAANNIFRRKAQTDDKDVISMIRGSLYGTGSHMVAPQLPFCARVNSESCLILDIDAAHDPHWGEIVKRERQRGTTEKID